MHFLVAEQRAGALRTTSGEGWEVPVCQWQGTKGCCPNDARFTCGQFAMTDLVWAFGQRHEMELGWGAEAIAP